MKIKSISSSFVKRTQFLNKEEYLMKNILNSSKGKGEN